MLAKLQNRISSEKGFTLIEMLIVIIILGILLAIAVPAYLSFRDRANKSAAAANIRAAIPAMEAYNADNIGTANDADTNASTTGYQGMTEALLQNNYDKALKSAPQFAVVAVNITGYCVTATSGTKTYWKQAATDITDASVTPACTAAG